jgi:hypothetical protein
MNDPRTERPDPQLVFLRELLGELVIVAGDVVEVGLDTWAIHGSIPVDGEVIMAEYHTHEQARRALGQLTATSATVASASTAFPEGRGGS